jgi:hypothetical protein
MDFRYPEQTIAALAVLGISVLFLWRFIVWLSSSSRTPDPWDETVAAALESPMLYRCALDA